MNSCPHVCGAGRTPADMCQNGRGGGGSIVALDKIHSVSSTQETVTRAMVEDLYAWCFKVFVRYGAGRAGTWCYGMLTLPIWNKNLFDQCTVIHKVYHLHISHIPLGQLCMHVY